jgi:osmotically-inducible protein OsmY
MAPMSKSLHATRENPNQGHGSEAVMNSGSEDVVRRPSADERPDLDIARDAVVAIRTGLPISFERVNVTVANGWAMLEGRVEWQYQKDAAESKLRDVAGVRGVVNNITLQPELSLVDVLRKIDELGKAAEIDARRIRIDPKDGEVSRGTVRSWAEGA